MVSSLGCYNIRMANSHSLQSQEPLALAVSRIHRSRSLDDLQKNFFFVLPKFVNADAFGMYLFDDKLNTDTVFSYHANPEFLDEYEDMRSSDPLFKYLLRKKTFTHSLQIFDRQEWFRQPLHEFLSQWGLDYSIEAPLILDGHLKGTLNIARGGRKYFERDSLTMARFLCNEVDAVYARISKWNALKKELALMTMSSNMMEYISGRAQEVLELAIIGSSNRAISSRLNISENTVRHHLKRIYRVLGVRNRAQLVQRVLSARSNS